MRPIDVIEGPDLETKLYEKMEQDGKNTREKAFVIAAWLIALALLYLVFIKLKLLFH